MLIQIEVAHFFFQILGHCIVFVLGTILLVLSMNLPKTG
jgi:hypothetical protein